MADCLLVYDGAGSWVAYEGGTVGTDAFQIGLTRPIAGTNAGVPAGWTPDLTYTTTQNISGNDLLFEDVQFDCWVSITGKRITFRRCKFRGPVLTSQQARAIVNCYGSPGPEQILFEFCTWDPQTPVLSLQGLSGYQYTTRRCDVRGVEDGFVVYRPTAGPVATSIEANHIHDLFYASPDPLHSDNHSHADCIQAASAVDGLTVVGNNLEGFVDTAISTWFAPTFSGGVLQSGFEFYPETCALSCFVIGGSGPLKNTSFVQNWMDGSELAFINIGPSVVCMNVLVDGNRWGRQHSDPAVDDTWTISSGASQDGQITRVNNVYLDTGASYNGRKNG